MQGFLLTSDRRGTVIIASPAPPGSHPEDGDTKMIVLGIVLLVVGFLVHIPILLTIGIVVAVVGLILLALGSTGHQVGSRSHWY